MFRRVLSCAFAAALALACAGVAPVRVAQPDGSWSSGDQALRAQPARSDSRLVRSDGRGAPGPAGLLALLPASPQPQPRSGYRLVTFASTAGLTPALATSAHGARAPPG